MGVAGRVRGDAEQRLLDAHQHVGAQPWRHGVADHVGGLPDLPREGAAAARRLAQPSCVLSSRIRYEVAVAPGERERVEHLGCGAGRRGEGGPPDVRRDGRLLAAGNDAEVERGRVRVLRRGRSLRAVRLESVDIDAVGSS